MTPVFLNGSSLVLVPICVFIIATITCCDAFGSNDYLKIEPSDYCISVGEELGACVPLDQCQIFSRWLKQRPLVKRKLKTVVKYTCFFDLVEPRVCCPLIDLYTFSNYIKTSRRYKVRPNLIPRFNNNRESKKVQSAIHRKDDSLPQDNYEEQLLFPTDSSPTIGIGSRSPISNTNYFSPNTIVATNQQQQQKLYLIPSLDECGKSVGLGRLLGTFGAYPWLALIGFKNEQSGIFEHVCSGTIINKRYILSSADCLVRRYEQELTTIRVSEYDLSTAIDVGSPNLKPETYVDYEIEELIPYVSKKFDERSFSGPSLVRVSNDINFDSDFVKPICLPFWEKYKLPSPINLESTDFVKKSKFLVAGWGKVSPKSKWNNILQETLVEPSEPSECWERRQASIDADTEFCVGGTRRHNICTMDNGGPLMVPLRLGPSATSGRSLPFPRVFQVGVLSVGPDAFQCRNETSYEDKLTFLQTGTVNTPSSIFVKVQKFLPWILENIRS